jgi:outer membrane immunogenic protein
MQKTLVAASFAALLGMGGAALAADVYAAGGSKDAVFVAPNTWAGFYVGVDLGGLIDDNDMKSRFYKVYKFDPSQQFTTHRFSKSGDANKDEPIGGVHIGYNFQAGNIVYGIEGDVNFADNIDYLATIRGRLGLVVDSWLLYGTGGVAFIGYNNDYAISDQSGTRWSFSDSHDSTGFVVGGGVEKKITPNISFGVEGLYYNFDSEKTTHFLDKDWCKKYYAEMSHDEDFFTIRARLTYHFPVAAEYVSLK